MQRKIKTIKWIKPEHWDFLQEELCNIYFPMPTDLRIIGITGTNGKTSTAFYTAQILEHLGVACVVLGTLGVRNAAFDILQEEKLTTLPYIELRKIFFRFKANAKVFILEVSSHALVQNRLGNIKIHSGGWTNFSRDHLDYHGSLENYFQAKLKIFDKLKPLSHLFVPGHEASLQELLNKSGKSYSVAPNVYIGNNILSRNANLAFAIAGQIEPGVAQMRDFVFNNPPGRMEHISLGDKHCIVDFAHTPEGLRNLLLVVKKEHSAKSIVLVFGCGGDRDQGKRRLMGEVAQSLADYVIVTSDNPRFEDPNKIIDNIILGIDDKLVFREPERQLAIEKAIDQLGADAILVVAGKGDEAFIDYGNSKIEFHDASFIRKYLKQGKK